MESIESKIMDQLKDCDGRRHVWSISAFSDAKERFVHMRVTGVPPDDWFQEARARIERIVEEHGFCEPVTLTLILVMEPAVA